MLKRIIGAFLFLVLLVGLAAGAVQLAAVPGGFLFPVVLP